MKQSGVGLWVVEGCVEVVEGCGGGWTIVEGCAEAIVRCAEAVEGCGALGGLFVVVFVFEGCGGLQRVLAAMVVLRLWWGVRR